MKPRTKRALAILAGVATPTEAASIAVLYAMVMGVFVYRKVSWADTVEMLIRTSRITGIVFLIIASVVGQTITFTTNHGISAAGGTLEPTTYADASTTHKADAYLASNDALPVLASDQAQNYA